MKPQIMTGNQRSRSFLLIALSLLIAASLCAGGCATTIVMNYAERKASPSNVTEFTIGKVHSATVHEDSDISVLVELDHPTHPKSGLYTITVPLSSLTDNAEALRSFGFRNKDTPSVSGLTGYLYPMGKAKKLNDQQGQTKDSHGSPVLIEELNLHRDEAERVFELLGDMNSCLSRRQKVYVINLLPGTAGKALQGEPGSAVEEGSTVENRTVLVYRPPLDPDGLPKTIAIAGAYEDESTNLYYLLVPPAIAVDSFLIALAVAVEAASLGLLGHHY